MTGILYSPMRAHRTPKFARLDRQRTQVIADFRTRLAIEFACRFHHSDALQITPLRLFRQEVRHRRLQITPGLDAPMFAVNRPILADLKAVGPVLSRRSQELFHLLSKMLVVLDAVSEVYEFEAQTVGMNADERLAYHQQQSGPVMEELKEWIEKQFGEHLVEPNSNLGKALQYWRNHWEELTTFLSVAGTPLDNNPAERSLKPVVLLRKNSLFCKTEHGTSVGDILASLIETCRLNGVNAWD
jgi:hypothetical protein